MQQREVNPQDQQTLMLVLVAASVIAFVVTLFSVREILSEGLFTDKTTESYIVAIIVSVICYSTMIIPYRKINKTKDGAIYFTASIIGVHAISWLAIYGLVAIGIFTLPFVVGITALALSRDIKKKTIEWNSRFSYRHPIEF